MITPKSIQLILETTRIEDIVGDFVNLKRRGVNMIGNCPFHSEKTPSFTVSPTKNLFKCFGCGKGGSPVTFLMEHENYSYPEALRWLAQKYNIRIEETETTAEYNAEKQLQDSLYIVTEFAGKYYQQQLFDTDKGKSIGLSYFKERGFREETVRRFALGYAPEGWNHLTQYAENQGFTKEHLNKVGLTVIKEDKSFDFFRNRVIFPIHNLSGKITAFAGRVLGKIDNQPKYINSPETDIYHKSKSLYAFHLAKNAIRQADECILTEGYTDVISLHQAGIENVVASSGTSLTIEQIALIKRYTSNIIILYDGDAAGIKAALRGLDMVLEQDANVKILLLPDGDDPDSYIKKVGATAFREYLKKNVTDFIVFKINLLLAEAAGDPIKKVNLTKDIVVSIAKMPDPIKRAVFVRECSVRMQIDEGLLAAEINKHLTSAFQKKHAERVAAQEKAATTPPPNDEFLTYAEPTTIPTIELPKTQPNVTPDEHQERDFVRVLMEHGGKKYEKTHEMQVAGFMLSNIQDILGRFENQRYARVAKITLTALTDGAAIDTNFYLHHPESDIRQLAIELLHSPYEYSVGWDARQMPLQTQATPENNQYHDARQAVHRLKLKKIAQLLEENQVALQQAQLKKDDEEIDLLLQIKMVLNKQRNDLALFFKKVYFSK
jgi:DNA primase